MGDIETELLAYIKLRHSEGALAVPDLEIIGAVAAAHGGSGTIAKTDSRGA